MQHLALALLGTFEATLDGRTLSGFESAKTRALLAYVAVEADHPHTRAALAGLFWPELSEEAARTNLRQVLANLRQVLDQQHAEVPFLLITRDSVRFNQASDHRVDIVAFKELLAACERHAHRRAETCRSCARRLAEATMLYRGSFLQGLFTRDTVDFEQWILSRREALHQQALEALDRLAIYHEQRGAYGEMQEYARRQLALDPWREEAHRQLMRALALDGQRSAALAQYERCRNILEEELGVEPSAETIALYDQIRVEQAVPPRQPQSTLTRLPLPLTPFVGREQELAEIGRLLEAAECRIITLAGPGGVGKTRLALQAAADDHATFPDGVYFVPLASVRSLEYLVPAIAAALCFTFTGQAEPRAELVDYLRDKQLLLILDNVEHLLQTEGLPIDLLVESLELAPGVVIMATSRERLRLQAEWVVEIAGLDYPADEQTADLADYSAVRLFAERGRRARSGFVLEAREHAHVAHICRLMEGLPLGIELAAASLGTHSCQAVARELETNLLTLATTYRDVPARHRSLRAALDYSWQLLAATEQQGLRQLAVFQGGFDAAAAGVVAGTDGATLSALVDKSLLQRETGAGEDQRFNLHNAIRQYAWEQLRAAGETLPARRRHLDLYIELAEEAETHLQGVEQAAWLERLEREHNNLRAALAWCLQEQMTEAGLRLAGALWRWWYSRGYLSEGRRWLEQALELTLSHAAGTAEQTPRPDAQFLAKALNGAGNLAWLQGDYVTARSHFDNCLAIRRVLGDRRGVATVLNNLGNVTSDQRDYAAAQAYYGDSLSLWRELGDRWGIAIALMNIGSMASERGEYAVARPLLAESLALRRELGDTWGIAGSLDNLGVVAAEEGDYVAARALHTESLALQRQLGDKLAIAVSLANLASAAHEQADYSTARALYTESLKLRREIGQTRGIPGVLEGLAAVEGVAGPRPEDARRAARLYGAAAGLRETLGVSRTHIEGRHYERHVAATRARLAPREWDRGWAEGREMPIDQAIDDALREPGGGRQPGHLAPAPSPRHQ